MFFKISEISFDGKNWFKSESGEYIIVADDINTIVPKGENKN